jgi:hypothetical protein
MSEPWFTEQQQMYYAWIPGTALGCLGGLWGAMAGILAPSGKAKRLVLGSGWLLLAVSIALLLLGVIGLLTGQPYGVWYGLLLPGVGGSIVFGVLMPVVLLRFRQAEQRQIEAKDI